MLFRSWLERGTLSARFVQPVYDGEEITVEAFAETGEPTGGVLSVAVRNPDGEVCATGTATLPDAPADAPDPAGFPPAPLPDERPPADERSLAPGTVLGSVSGGFHADRSAPFLALLADDADVYAAEGLAHPGYLILSANTILGANVRLGPWIHVGSDVTNLAPVADGALVETRGRVSERFERKGHQFVVLDVLWLADGVPAMRARHTAIYRLRDTPG